ncbi:MAG: hypothetical protein KAQ95_09485 [Candidatus Heimdallarchaeota archaeon]|nr:hypothetical protein [Candidatus Heimdallarchaeota archaeon]
MKITKKGSELPVIVRESLVKNKYTVVEDLFIITAHYLYLQAESDVPPKLRIDAAAYNEKGILFVVYLTNKHSLDNLHILTKLANKVHVAVELADISVLEDSFKERLKSLGIGLVTENDKEDIRIISPPLFLDLPIQTTEKIRRSIDFKLHLDNFYSSAIIIDGSNALLWNTPEGEKGKVADLELMIDSLKELGFTKFYPVIGPSMVFRVDDKARLEQLMKKSNWIKAPPNIDSDIILLDKAVEENGYVVSNDKFDNHTDYARFLHKRSILFHFSDNKVRFNWAHNQKLIKGKIDESINE